jgi:uncharacterized protein YyaL (SSP411 family)
VRAPLAGALAALLALPAEEPIDGRKDAPPGESAGKATESPNDSAPESPNDSAPESPSDPAPEKPVKKPNRLAKEKSPYLLQHAHNPVDWYPWGDEAFEKARREGKPIFLSIGYSTCHWCHVMERESFEDEEIAAFLNEHFISIKVDREERPDVDSVYMSFVQAATGGGGWPLTAFLTPEKKPFFGATYFPPRDDPRRGPGFLTILQRIQALWRDDRKRLLESADQVQEALRGHAEARAAAGTGARLDPGILDRAAAAFASMYDPTHGGFGHAPKFPRTTVLDFLMRWGAGKGAKDTAAAGRARQMVTGTLDAMLRGGIRDHLAGGFHRYSTDARWLVPHFEKMLYDQALIARTLADAWRFTGEERYREGARDTMDYVLGRMSGPEGELYSAEDADTEGVEGKTYTWELEEVIEILGKERGERFAAFYGVTAGGNFEEGGEGASILHVAGEGSAAEFAEDRAKLLGARDRRPQPLRDDKVLVEWNGLGMSALAHVHQITGDARYLDAARRVAVFIRDRMTRDGKLHRRFRQGELAIEAFLEDHAFLIEGLLDLHEASFEPRWLEEAVRLGKDMLRLFRDERDGAFFSSGAHHEALPVREKEFYDGAVPSGNSVAFLGLLRLAEITQDPAFRKAADSMEDVAAAVIGRSSESHPYLLCGAWFRLAGPKEVIIAGAPDDPFTRAMKEGTHRLFAPAKVVAWAASAEDAAKLAKLVPLIEGKGPIEGKPAGFVCRNGVCALPARDIETFRRQLTEP